MGTHKVFFEICRKFGHAPSRKFASPELASGVALRGVVWLLTVMTDLSFSLVQSNLTQSVPIQPPF